jgi:cysteine desulfurase / selenocysteine lyase
MDLLKIREQFPALNQTVNNNKLVYFDNAATSLKPISVIESITDYYSTINSNVHRASHYLSSMSTRAYEKSRENIAEFINANPGEIIFTSGTTDSINTLASGLSDIFLKEGDEIILTVLEHHSNIVPWVALKRDKKIVLKIVDVDDKGILKLDHLRELITEKTKIISISHSSNVLGTINPVSEIVTIAREKGIITIIDGAQAVAHSKVNVNEINSDFYCFSGHKMFGPMGIGVLYGKSEILEKLSPFRFGGGMIRNVSFESVEYNCLPNRLEAGTPYVSGAVGLSKAVDFLNNLEFSDIIEHEQRLTDYATDRLKKIEKLTIMGDNTPKDPIISFNIEGIHHADLSMILDNFGIAVRSGQHCTQPLMHRFGLKGTIRMSFSIYNTLEEIDFFIEKLNLAIKMLR